MIEIKNEGLHPDTFELVQEFSKALAEKLLANQRKYGYQNEWLVNDWEDECRTDMMKHIQKGDPRDVAIYAAFMWKRGWSTAAKGDATDKLSYEQLDNLYERRKDDARFWEKEYEKLAIEYHALKTQGLYEQLITLTDDELQKKISEIRDRLMLDEGGQEKQSQKINTNLDAA